MGISMKEKVAETQLLKETAQVKSQPGEQRWWKAIWTELVEVQDMVTEVKSFGECSANCMHVIPAIGGFSGKVVKRQFVK